MSSPGSFAALCVSQITPLPVDSWVETLQAQASPLSCPFKPCFCALPGSLSQVVAALWPEHQSLHPQLGVHATTWVSTKLDSHL